VSRLVARLGAAALLLVIAAPAAAQDGDDEDEFPLRPPPALPEGINGVVRPGPGPRPEQIGRIRDVFAAVRACWMPPRGSGFSGQELTLRLSFKRTGEVLGTPRITYYRSGDRDSDRDSFANSVREAFERCTPLPVTPALGAAIAGRPFTFRFIDSRPL
jgi:hypothetical protein